MVKIDGEMIKISPDPINENNFISGLLTPENKKFILDLINGINKLLENRNMLNNPNQLMGGNRIRNIPNEEQEVLNDGTTTITAQQPPQQPPQQPQQPLNNTDIINDLIGNLDQLITILGENCTLGQLKEIIKKNPDSVIMILKAKGVIK